MSGKWSKTKGKRPLETSLGSAPKEADSVPDFSHLRKPIGTSIFGLKEVLTLFQTATTEVQDYITYECDVLYECRVCRTIFRSIANLILHKRNFCKSKFNSLGGQGEGGFVVLENTKNSDEESRAATPEGKSGDEFDKKETKKMILPIVDRLIKKQEINILAKNTLNEDLSVKNENSDDDVVFVSEENNVVLQKIDTSEVAVFQTAVKEIDKVKTGTDLMKSEVMEIHGILENNEAVLGSNGKVCTFETNKKTSKPNIPKQNLRCTECKVSFSTEKSFTHHIKYKHNKTCMVYPCPDCNDTFSNPWNVYRHLYKIHKRTSAQVRRMRAQIHSNKIRKDQEPEKKKVKYPVQESEENQWMNNFEGDKDLQMCGGCGKRFERRAALHSHSQMCTKRMAVCNTIKENQKTKPAEKGKASEKVEKVNGVKGAAKRKSKLMIRHKVELETVSEDSKEEKIEENDEEGCEVQDLQEPNSEIFTISDDSNDSEGKQSLQRAKKRAASDICRKPSQISDDFKEYLNDEFDQCFVTTALPYVARDELKCIPCQTKCLSPYQLLWHMSLHFSWYRFQCSRCSYVSFNKYDCTTHAYVKHGTPTNLIGNIVLPIPKWKVLSVSHKFTELADEKEAKPPDAEDANPAMPRLEAVLNGLPQTDETIILEDDDMPDICSESPRETVVLSDDEQREEKEERVEKAGPSKEPISRPIRNRTKSVKTVQNDFIYDLAKVLKLDGSKKSKMKKAVNKS